MASAVVEASTTPSLATRLSSASTPGAWLLHHVSAANPTWNRCMLTASAVDAQPRASCCCARAIVNIAAAKPTQFDWYGRTEVAGLAHAGVVGGWKTGGAVQLGRGYAELIGECPRQLDDVDTRHQGTGHHRSSPDLTGLRQNATAAASHTAAPAEPGCSSRARQIPRTVRRRLGGAAR